MWLSFIQHTVNCCVFKTHSVLGSLPRKVHFPFPIQPHGLSSATQVFSPIERHLRQQSEHWLPKGPLSLTTDFDPVLWRTHISQQIRHSLSALRGAQVWFYSLHSETVTACLSGVPLSISLHALSGVFALVNCVFPGIDLLTFEQLVRWLTGCAVSGLKSPAAMWELLSFAWAQSLFSQIRNSRH